MMEHALDFAGALRTLQQVQKLPGSPANLGAQMERLRELAAEKTKTTVVASYRKAAGEQERRNLAVRQERFAEQGRSRLAARQRQAASQEKRILDASHRLTDLGSSADRRAWEELICFSKDQAASASPADAHAQLRDLLPSQKTDLLDGGEAAPRDPLVAPILGRDRAFFQTAVKLHSNAIEVLPDRAVFWTRRGHAQLKLRKDQAALEDFNVALAVSLLPAHSLHLHALCHWHLDRKTTCQEALQHNLVVMLHADC